MQSVLSRSQTAISQTGRFRGISATTIVIGSSDIAQVSFCTRSLLILWQFCDNDCDFQCKYCAEQVPAWTYGHVRVLYKSIRALRERVLFIGTEFSIFYTSMCQKRPTHVSKETYTCVFYTSVYPPAGATNQ